MAQTISRGKETLTMAGASGAEQWEYDTEFHPLRMALEWIGCETQAGMEPGAGSRETGALRMPAVTFRAPGPLLTEILDLVCELSARPPSRASLSHSWCVESHPNRQGGVLHTLTPRHRRPCDRLSELDVEAARRDSATLAAFLLMRRGRAAEATSAGDETAPTPAVHRLPSARGAGPRFRGYVRGTLAIASPQVAARR